MNHNECLNCKQPVAGNYCQNCGQKTNTHAITLKHFFFHDIIHGVWHLEKGILLTIKETFIRPGKAALDYINGKRVKYYNVFYLILMLIGLNILTVHFHHEINPSSAPKNIGSGLKLFAFLTNNLKILLLGFIPLMAINAFIIFRKLKLNLAEHFIIGGINLLGILVLSLLINLVSLLDSYKAIEFLITVIKIFLSSLLFLFPFWTYFNAAHKRYSALGFAGRILLFYIILTIEIIFIFILTTIIVTNQSSIHLNL